MADDKSLRDDVAELTEAVRELRDREVADEIRSLREEIAALRAERAAHSCAGHCGCMHVHYQYQPYPAPYTVPYPVTYPSVTYMSTGSMTDTLSVSDAGAAAPSSAYQLSLGN